MGAPTDESGSRIVTAPSNTIQVQRLRKSFPHEGERRLVLNDIDLEIQEGEFVSIIGPSGCGKSTLFNILAGLDVPDAGDVLVHGRNANGQPDHFAYMPQKDSLLPWRRVLDNACLGLEIQGVPRKHARAEAAELIPTFGLSGYEQCWPWQLSGGMRQRVALLRTVLQHRNVLLLDEPFGALDSLTRRHMQNWLLDVWERYHWTVVLITHDIREAVFLSDRVYALTGRPASVHSQHVIDAARPRTAEMFIDPDVAAVEVRLLAALGADRPISSPAGTT